MSAFEIQSAGRPPEQHADRVVAEMLREMAKTHARLWAAVDGIVDNSRDGNPRSQRKMEAKIRAAGAVDTILTPGKRGRYALWVFSYVGWDPARDAVITLADPIPPKPWVASVFHEITGEGRGWINTMARSLFYISHHALSRAAQRWGFRTSDQMLKVIRDIGDRTMKYILDTGIRDEHWCDTPPRGIRIPLADDSAAIVLKKHEKRHALVVATVL
jgi:hypothetical protein